MSSPAPSAARSVKWLEASAYVVIFGVALWLRVNHLDNRVMHGDEAVHAVKLGALLERGVYDYDPHEYHGPTPYYLALIAAKLRGQSTLASLDEWTLRIGPALVSSLGVLAPVIVRCGLTPSGALLAAVWLAVSPSLVFYSRYFIQEPVLSALTVLAICAGWRGLRHRSVMWGGVSGVAAGAMVATKETAAIAIVTALIAAIGAWAMYRPGGRAVSGESGVAPGPRSARSVALPIGAGVAAAFITLFLLITNFGRSPGEFFDVFRAVAIYTHRGVGGEGLHLHPFGYYLLMLVCWRASDGGPIWSEAPLVMFALVGAVAGFTGWGRHPVGRRSDAKSTARLLPRAPFKVFLSAFVILLTLAYSAIPYKTPWSMTQFVAPMALLAGLGASVVLRGPMLVRAIGIIGLTGAIAFATMQSRRATTDFENSYRNPYVYAHPLRDVVHMATFVEQLANCGDRGRATRIDVIHPNPWPLPWYLRRLTRVGWWEDEQAWRAFVARHGEAPIRIRAFLPDEAFPSVEPCWTYGLRPDATLLLCVEPDLYERFAERAAKATR
ncbi:MAG: TIGR03663 family protein [Phycisphaerales bacterium]|nr:TIGR03663 family protein [Phycisphaerales bacterium]